MIRLFISHSAKDAPIAERLIELVQAALNLPASSIRCTSVDGYRLPGGASTDDQLRTETLECDAFIGLVSPNSIKSMYVAFELGARWGAGKHLLPVLAPGVRASILDGPLTGLNALKSDSRPQLQQFMHDLAQHLGMQTQSPAAYDRFIDRILELPLSKPDRQDIAVETDDSLHEIQIEIMKIMPNMARGEATVDRIARQLQITHGKAEYYLTELCHPIDLLTWVGNMDRNIPSFYEVTHKGQGWLVERGLL